MFSRISISAFTSSILPVALGLAAAASMAMSGCGSGSSVSNIQVGPITFTDMNGSPLKNPPTALTTGEPTYVDVTLTNDPQLLGADWSVYCGSALPPGTPLPPGEPQNETCGTFTPAHTMSTINGLPPSYVTSGAGYVAFYTAPPSTPKLGTVTLYAVSTSDHSKFSSTTLTIGGLPISVGFAPTPPATLQTSFPTQLRVVLNNDVADAGVNWTVICGSSDCGSFNPTKTTSAVDTIYTAPATVPIGGSIKVTATSIADPTKAATATISIQ